MAKINLDKIQAKGDGNIVSVVQDTTDLPNGSLVSLGNLLDGERELFEALAPEDDKELLLVAAPEVKYEERVDELDFTTEAGHPVRAYHLKRGDMFQVEVALFDATPEQGDTVTGSANFGYTQAGEDAITTFKVERLGKLFFDRRDMVLLRVL